MEIVIKISEEDYKLIKSYGKDSTNYRISLNLYDAVKNGVPLPKGHGRLIDADDIEKHIVGSVDTRDCPTIIEAEGSDSK